MPLFSERVFQEKPAIVLEIGSVYTKWVKQRTLDAEVKFKRSELKIIRFSGSAFAAKHILVSSSQLR